MASKKKATNKKATAVAAGLTAVAVATGVGVGVANLSEPTAIVEEQGDFAGAMSDLEQAVNNLVDKSDERGMTLPQSPGINDVTTGMGGMAPTKGTTRSVKVASGGSIAKGDYIKVCEEFTLLQDKSFATGGAKIVAVTSNSVGGIECEDRTVDMAVVLYTKSGNTYLRAAKFKPDGSITFSNNLLIESNTVLEYADMAFNHKSQQIIIAYNKGGDGWITRVQCEASTNQLSVTWQDKWNQGGDPKNICMAYDNFSGFACICSTVLPSGSTDESTRRAVVEEMYVDATGAMVSPTSCVLTAEEYPCLYGIDYITEETGGGWDIAYATNWYEDMMARKALGESPEELIDDDLAGFVVHVTYPTKREGVRGLAVLEHKRSLDLACTARSYIDTTAPGDSSTSTVAIDVGATLYEMKYAAMTDVVHSVAGSEKNFLFTETYSLQGEALKPVLFMRDMPQEVYDKPLENISYALLMKESAIGYTVDGEAYAQIHELQRAGSIYGPAIKVADVDDYAALVPVNADKAAFFYVDAAGAGHVVPLQKTRVVAKETDSMAAWAVGTALEAGEPGETIRADLNYWPDEKW